MAYCIRVDGKRLSFGFSRLQPAISSAEAVEPPTAKVEVVDDGGDVDRLVWTRKGASNEAPKSE